jgi:FkbM family methyltransferase
MSEPEFGLLMDSGLARRMGPTRLVRTPVEAFRRVPHSRMKEVGRDYLYRHFGTPRGHPRLCLPRKHLLTDPTDTVVQVGTPNSRRIHQYAALTSGEVLILEPERENYERLSAAAEEFDDVTVDPRAAGRANQVVEFRHSEGGTGRVATAEGPESPRTLTETQTVEMAELDDVTAEYELSPDFVEVMVNGAETNVLGGADRVLREDGPKLLIKSYGVGTDHVDYTREIRTHLEEYGYTVSTAPRRKRVPGHGSPDGDIFAWK